MRSLTLKIFVSYWITAALVIVVLNLAGSPMHRPEFGRALDTLLGVTGSTVASAIETHGCQAQAQFPPPAGTTFGVVRPDGSAVCASSLQTPPELLKKALATKGRMSRKFRLDREEFAMAVTSTSGTPYVFLMEEPYAQHGMILGVLTPSYTTFTISILFTLLLAFMLTRPLRQLRFATQELASGKLDTRVPGGQKSGKSRSSDEISGLIDDFNHMADRLETALSAQHLLLRDVSHELRSPLARLQVALELSRKHNKDGSAMYLDRIGKEAGTMNELVSELLSLSFMETMRGIPDPGLVSLSDLINRLVQDARFEAVNSAKTVTAAIHENCYVLGDVVLLRRAVDNLLRNAARYSPEDGTVHVTLDINETDDAAIITVEDNGPGIPEHEIDSIVKPFYRVDRSRNEDTGGSGVGLSITARAVTLHHGTLRFSNRPSGGLSAAITLPLSAVPEMA